MKTLKFLTIFLLSTMTLVSCLVDDTVMTDDFDQGPNVLGFVNQSMNASVVADGASTDFTIPIVVSGPSLSNITSDMTASITVDPSSTAVEGVHYSLGDTSFSVSPDANLISSYTFTILSEGIESPSDKTLILNITDLSDSETQISGRSGSITISILYLCFSDLVATYHVTVTRLSDGAVFDQGLEQLFLIEPGYYKTVTTGGWEVGTIADDQGYNFIDFCGEITVPDQNLCQGYYSNEVYQTANQAAASAVGENGNLHIEYTIGFEAGDTEYANEYILQ